MTTQVDEKIKKDVIQVAIELAVNNSMAQISMPDIIDEPALSVVDGYVFILSFEHDCCASNPLEDWDAMGTITSFNSRHINSCKSAEEAEALLKNKDAVRLGYFEHGRCIWHISDEIPVGTAGDYRWDGNNCAGVWLPDKYLLEEAKGKKGEERKALMKKWAKEACEVYTQFCNGDVYDAIVKIYKARFDDETLLDEVSDYESAEPIEDDCCGGYYGDEAVKDYFHDNCVWFLNDLYSGERQKRAIQKANQEGYEFFDTTYYPDKGLTEKEIQEQEIAK
jgi:hypothetical protein